MCIWDDKAIYTKKYFQGIYILSNNHLYYIYVGLQQLLSDIHAGRSPKTKINVRFKAECTPASAGSCQGYCKMCRKYKIKFGGSTCSSQVISLTKQKQNLNNFKIKVYYSAGILCQGTHKVVVVVVVFANVVVVVGVKRSGNVFARQRGASQVLVK